MSDPNNLFFDIETTGLSPSSSHVTVIGTVFLDGKKPVLNQFVCERPMDEKKILREFSNFAMGFRRIVHYNGKSFDIPYLRKKFSFYRISDPFYDMEQVDLYLTAKKFSPLFPTSGLKQKDIEALFGFPRTDELSGADCVFAYREYVRTGVRSHMEKILLHNREDLLGMVHIRSCLDGFLGMTEGRFSVTGISDPDGNDLSIRLALDRPFLKPFELTPSGEEAGIIPFTFSAGGSSGVFTLPGTYCEKKYFFEDYRDYYFLPLEGRAVHRSVGQFVDPAYRRKATRATAYEPVSALFYPQARPVVRPAFRSSAEDGACFFRAEDVKSSEELKEVIRDAFCSALKKQDPLL